MKKRILYYLFIGITIAFIVILIKRNSEEQYWLKEELISMEIENKITGEKKNITTLSEIEQVLSALKSINYTSNKPEETWGLGYSIKIKYDKISVEYYFATSTHLIVSINDKKWREYLIEPNINSIYTQLQNSFRSN